MFKNEKQTGCKTTKGKDGANIDSYFIRLKEGKKNVHFVNLFHKFNKEIERERKTIQVKLLNENLSCKDIINKKRISSPRREIKSSSQPKRQKQISKQKIRNINGVEEEKSSNKRYKNKSSLEFYPSLKQIDQLPFSFEIKKQDEFEYNEEISEFKNDYIKKMLTTHQIKTLEPRSGLKNKKFFSFLYHPNIQGFLQKNNLPMSKKHNISIKKKRANSFNINKNAKSQNGYLRIKPFYYNNFSDPKYYQDNFLISNILKSKHNPNQKLKLKFVNESCSCHSIDLNNS